MVSGHFNLKIPGLHRWSTIKSWHGTITKHKQWDISISKVSSAIAVDFWWTPGGNRPGVRVGIALVGFEITAELYDERLDAGVFQ